MRYVWNVQKVMNMSRKIFFVCFDITFFRDFIAFISAAGVDRKGGRERG